MGKTAETHRPQALPYRQFGARTGFAVLPQVGRFSDSPSTCARLVDGRNLRKRIWMRSKTCASGPPSVRKAACPLRSSIKLTKIGNHSFRAGGITAYLQNGGRLEVAQQLAAHESSRTTGLYDRRDEEISRVEGTRLSRGCRIEFRSIGREADRCASNLE
jgi:hypothetical protein